MTKEEFIEGYAARSGKTVEEIVILKSDRGYTVQPCDCGLEGCEGWGWELTEEVEMLARKVVQRVLSVYREDYIEQCVKNEPNSLLALVKDLELALLDREIKRGAEAK